MDNAAGIRSLLDSFVIGVGEIIYADPIKKVYVIQAMRGNPDRASFIYAVSTGTSSLSQPGVRINPYYRAGDFVLYAASPMTGESKMPSVWGVILGIFPGNLGNNTIIPDNEITENSGINFYNSIEKLLGWTAYLKDRNFYDDWRSFELGGEVNIAGKNTLLTLSDNLITLKTELCGTSYNAVYGDIKQFGFTHSEDFAGVSASSKVINQSIFHEEKLSGHLLRSYVEAKTPSYDIIKQAGDVVQGEISTALNSNGNPVSQIFQGYDGSVKLKNASTFISDKTINLTYLDNIYQSPINRDEQVKITFLPFSGVAGSKNWSAKSLFQDKTSANATLPGSGNAPDDLVKTLYDTDKRFNGQAPYPVYQDHPDSDQPGPADVPNQNIYSSASSRIAQLADGSIVLRDAWGSEILMKDGDIQFSAANKISLVSSDDILAIAGGVTAVNSSKGIQLGSSEGDLALRAKRSIQINSDEKIVNISKAQVNMIDGQILDLCSSYGMTCNSSAITVKGSWITESDNAVLFGKSRSVIAANHTAVDLGGGLIRQAGQRTVFYTDVDINSGSYFSNRLIPDYTVNITGRERTLSVSGNARIARRLNVNEDILSAGSVFARTAGLKETTQMGGVYKLKEAPGKVELKPQNYGAKTRLNQWFITFLNLIDIVKKEDLVAELFNAPSKLLTIFKPIFSRSTKYRTRINPTQVESDGKRFYIYPGETFWQATGVSVQTPIDLEYLIDPKTVTITKLPGTSLQLNKR